MADLYSAPTDLEIIIKKSDTTLLECLLCCETFRNKEDLLKHGENHNKPQKYQCKVCYKYFGIKSSFKNHARVHRKRDKICNICGKGFYTPVRLKNHIEALHGEERPHSCPHCPKAFSALISLQGHLRNSHREKEYHCTNCDKKFAKKYALAEHLSSQHSNVRTFHCDICGKSYATKRSIRYHISKSHTDVTYNCPYCEKQLARKSSLNVHIQNIHVKPRSQCQLCMKFHEVNASQQGDVCPHISQHEIERFRCQICEVKFRTRNELKSHNFQEHRERRYLCDECGQAFDSTAELEEHTAGHSSEKKYVCDICGNRYRGQTALKRHRLNHFEKQIQCPLCTRKFTREYLLRLHMPTHVNEKNLKCDQCSAFFRSRASLKQHELIKHKTKAEFVCKYCSKTFTVLRAFKQHQKKVHTCEDYECDFCRKRMRNKAQLKVHIVHHMEMRHTREDFAYSCAECQRNFRSADKMNQHMSTHVAAKPFRCNICGKDFRNFSSLQSHSKRHVKKQTHLCEQCGYVCQYEEVLENHITKYHSGPNREEHSKVEGYFPQDTLEDEVNERFSCEECHRDFESLTLLSFHKQTHLYECAVCKQDLRTEKLLSEHIAKQHKRKSLSYSCNVCQENFNSKELIKKHLVAHKKQLKQQVNCSQLDEERIMEKITTQQQRLSQKRDQFEQQDSGMSNSVESQVRVEKPKKSLKRKRVGQEKNQEKKVKEPKSEGKQTWTCQSCELVFLTHWQWKTHRQNYHADSVKFRKRRKNLSEPIEREVIKPDIKITVERPVEPQVESSQPPRESGVPNSASQSDTFETLVSDIVEEGQLTDETVTGIAKGNIVPTKSLCDLCPLSFDSKLNLMAHYEQDHLRHIRTNNCYIQCQRCDQNFIKVNEFVEHMKNHNPKIKILHRCRKCMRTFENTETLNEHVGRHEKNTIDNFPCAVCDVVFKSHKGIKIHLLRVHGHWKCKYCDKVLPMDDFQSHLLDHVTEVDSQMDVDEMNKAYSQSVENEELSFKRQKLRTIHHCPYCDFSIITFKNFNFHLLKTHQLSKCKSCNLIMSVDKVQQHNDEVHKLDNTFKCPDCDATFSNFNKVYYHRRSTHMYRCPNCVMLYFPTLDTYKEHLKSHGINFQDQSKKIEQSKNASTDVAENSSDVVKERENLSCAECGKAFQSKQGLAYHVSFMFKPKPRWQKVIFRCDPPWKRCNYCKKTLKNLTIHYQGGSCPEKRKKEREKRFEEMKKIIEFKFKQVELRRRMEFEIRQLKQKMKMEENMRMRMLREENAVKGYKLKKGKTKEIQCRWCHSIFYHEDGYRYHVKNVCKKKNIYRRMNGLKLKEVRIFVKKMELADILKHTDNRIPSIIVEAAQGKRQRRPPKCFCCKGRICYSLKKVTREYNRKTVSNCSNESEVAVQNTLNEDEILDAMDIKIESESITEMDCLTMEQDISDENITSNGEIDCEYEKELNMTMQSIKEQFVTFNTMIENNYLFYNKVWAKAGTEFCSLETVKKAQKERTWNYTCHQIPVQLVDITKKNDNRYYDKQQYSWKIKCNSVCPPAIVEETIKVFHDFFDSWKTLVEPFLSKQEVINLRKEVIAIEIHADIANNLFVMITVCNENTSIEKAFQYYFIYANVVNIKSITYRNIETDKNGKTAFKKTIIYGEESVDQEVRGIKVNTDNFKFINQLGSFEVLSKTIEQYLCPNKDVTLLEIGCKNGFVGLSLSQKYKEIIGIDEEREIAMAEILRLYNDITNSSYKICSSQSIKNIMEKYDMEQLHAVVNIDVQWVTNLNIMRHLRNLKSLKSIVLVTSFSPKVYLPMSELITADPSFLGYPFIPVRSCVIDNMAGKHQFRLVMLLLREDVYEQKPIVKTELIDTSYMVETNLNVREDEHFHV